MKKIITTLTLLCILYSGTFAQQPGGEKSKEDKNKKAHVGLKAGYNWSYATADQSGVSLNSKNGYLFGVFISPARRGVMGYRTEIIYSKQGYSYDDGGKNTDVLNEYIYLPQLTTISIGKFFQLQFGAQVGFLLNSKKVTSSKDSSLTDLMNRLDYGFAGGIELNPIAGLIIGARYNLGLGKMYKPYQESSSSPGSPYPYPLPFNPQTTNLKNGMIQITIGYKF